MSKLWTPHTLTVNKYSVETALYYKITLTVHPEQNSCLQSLHKFLQAKKPNLTFVQRKQTLPFSASWRSPSSIRLPEEVRLSSILARFKTERMWTTSSWDNSTDDDGDVRVVGVAFVAELKGRWVDDGRHS